MEVIRVHLEEVVTPEPGESPISPLLQDFSGKPDNFVRDRVSHLLEYVRKMVVFPDLSPTDERQGLLPTGSATEIDTLEHKDWLKLLGGSDMGCGIVFAEIDYPAGKEKAQEKLDLIYDKISQGEIWLGGGNHFIDIMQNAEGKHYTAIHTGAPRDEQNALNDIVEKAKIYGNWEAATAEYMAKYEEIMKSADENRKKILAVINEVYGTKDVMYHEPHNTIDLDEEKHTVTVYKGAVHVKDLSKPQFLPSSMTEGAVLFYPGPSVGEKTLNAVSHGTGKAHSTHVQREREGVNTRPNIMLPTSFKGEVNRGIAEGAYNSYKQTETTMLNNGTMRYEDEEDIKIFKTIAHINR